MSIPTSFYWRHKILEAIRAFMCVGSVGGVIEVDEAFFRESFKKQLQKSTTFTMPRKSHKRGVIGSYSSKSEERKKGISKEQVCVLCAMDSFNGVATKYLANYMYWFKWLKIFNTDKDTVKSKKLLVQSHTSHIDIKLKDFRIRDAIYI